MKYRILVIDDHLPNLTLTKAVLEAGGYEVTTAEDAEGAQDLLVGTPPDLILVDIALPGMNGLAFTRWLKADARLREIPVLALTAFAMAGDEVRALEAGCQGYITKPIDIHGLLRLIAQVLQIESPGPAAV
jgi:CheY-like chemotaxis protein